MHYLGEVEDMYYYTCLPPHLTLLCSKYIQDNKYKILLESAWFCRRCDKNIWCVLDSQFQLLFTYKTQYKLSQGSVATLFR